MAKNWYPEIDRMACVACGACVEKCGQGVYDKTAAPLPIIVHPDGCIDHCHGCGNLCPTGAISYVGEDTGWAAPALQQGEEAPCACGCAAAPAKEVSIEYLYLDLHSCDRCVGTDAVLWEVVEVLRPALELAGFRVTCKKVEISTPQLAEAYRFVSSPTVQVNGQDIFDTVEENNCGCCGAIAGVPVDCRVFEHNGQRLEVPTKEMLADAILKRIYQPGPCACGGYRLPENLRRFFEGKTQKEKTASCGCC